MPLERTIGGVSRDCGERYPGPMERKSRSMARDRSPPTPPLSAPRGMPGRVLLISTSSSSARDMGARCAPPAWLERGREWVPGTFPDRLFNFLPLRRRPTWINQQISHNRLGLFGLYDGDV